MLRNITAITTAIALTVSLVPAAGAQQDLRNPDNRASEPGQVSQDLRNPDRREAAPGGQDFRNPDTVDAARGVGTFSVDELSMPAPAQSPAGGFDWGDAGIGAAATLAMISLLAGLTMIGSHYRRRRVAAVGH